VSRSASALRPTPSNPADAFTKILKLIDDTTRGLPDCSKIPPDRDLVDVTPGGA
jgi:hypothetical protein